MSLPSTEIYRHVREPKYILMPLCIDKKDRHTTAWGKLVHLTEEDMRTRGLSIVLHDLEEFSSRDSSVGAEVNGMGPEAKRARRQLREYWHVGITLRPGPKLELQAIMDIGKDRGIGVDDYAELPLPSSPEVFFRTLNETFERCCVIEDP